MIPVDATTLFLLAGMLVSLIAGEAALYGDTLTLHINVAPNIVQAGFDGATAEQIFIAESARIVRGASITPTPTLRVSSRPTVMSDALIAAGVPADRTDTSWDGEGRQQVATADDTAESSAIGSSTSPWSSNLLDRGRQLVMIGSRSPQRTREIHTTSRRGWRVKCP